MNNSLTDEFLSFPTLRKWGHPRVAFLNLEEWDQAVEHLHASLQLEEHGYCYYWLALAQRRNRDDYRLNADEMSSILDLLQKACVLPACPVKAFLWLDGLMCRRNDDDGRTSLLQQAFARYPDVKEVRLGLANHLLYHLRNYESALTVVSPLLAEPEPSQEAISCYEQETSSGDFAAIFFGFFSVAKAWLTQQQIGKATVAAAQGAQIWFDNPNDSQCSDVMFHEPVSVSAEFTIGGETVGDEEAAQETQDMSVEVRRECHEIAWNFLQAHQDAEVIKAIFLSFYRSFWYHILIASDMHQEIVDVTTLLLKASPDADVDNELWDYAYSSDKLGNADEAERTYRSYLEGKGRRIPLSFKEG